MKPETRIKIAKKLLEKAREEQDRKRKTTKEIGRLGLWIEERIDGNPDKKTPEERLQECYDYRRQIEKLSKVAKKQGERAKGYYGAFEDCVMGVRNFNVNQLEFEDIKPEEPKPEPKKTDANKAGKQKKVSG